MKTTQKIRNVKIGSIGGAVLAIVAVAGVVSMVAILPGVSVAIAPFVKKKKYSKKQAITRNIDTLIKNGLLEKRKLPNGELALRLTNKGKWESGIRGMMRKNRDNKKWNGVWHVIIFDVPEGKRKIRDELRRAAKLYGFVQLQKSVWVYPYVCDDFVSLVKSHLGVANDVVYMKVMHIENDTWLRKKFGLYS